MNVLIWIIGATLLLSIISLVGVITLSIKHKSLEKILLLLVSLSAGALMGGAFFHLIPEALENSNPTNVFIAVIIGFSLFFLIEKVLHWRHCHKENCQIHTFAYMNLFGDGVHNFIDGLIIAASFMIDIKLGIVTTMAVALHEIPQEIGDFGVLLHAGFSKFKALYYNFFIAITAVLGGIIGFILQGVTESFTSFLLPFAAGGFLYISASDLIPEIRKEMDMKKSLLNLLVFLIGISLMYGLTII
jgi:zinc and cadmium transporter